MTAANTIRAACLGIALLLCWSPRAQGNIYRYVDKNGVLHFTNVKTDPKYTLYLRGSRKAPSEYIKDYGAAILEASKRFKVELPLIKAVIKAESNFDHEAVSKKGAKGLMQLMPRTADEMDVGDALDPKENIMGGTRYLGLMLKRFKNDKVLALAAYNAGPGIVESYNGVPPFPETEAFVKKVMKYYKSYSTGKK